jgi:hypothetical protein
VGREVEFDEEMLPGDNKKPGDEILQELDVDEEMLSVDNKKAGEEIL